MLSAEAVVSTNDAPSVSSLSSCLFFFQAEDGIRDLVRSRGLGDVYKRQRRVPAHPGGRPVARQTHQAQCGRALPRHRQAAKSCLLYTSDAADERSSVDLGGRRIIKKKKHTNSELESASHSNAHPDRCQPHNAADI